MANGAILFEGKSAIDGAPIVVIATGLKASSANAKTGALVQTWILRSDIAPQTAVDTGADESICGACPHRGTLETRADGTTKNVGRACYVTIFQAPRNIFDSYKRGIYPRVKGNAARALLAGRNVRLGAYGDPAAVAFHVWNRILADTARGTGYTHQWKACDSRFARYCMASADNAQEAEQARALGYRTFRVGTRAESIVQGAEFLCPASKEAGMKTNCAACLACGGTSSKNRASVFIPAHGAAGKINAFEKRIAEKESAH
jgi:hypothetical protein